MQRRVFLAGSASLALQAQTTNLKLFLLAGQSNMAGRGVVEAEDQVPVPGVLALSKEMEWKPAVDPIHYDKPIAAVGLGRSFARTLLNFGPQQRIGLVPAAMGGSSLDEWKPGGTLFTQAVRRAKAAAPAGVFCGILWHQGEADSSKEELARSYTARWVPMMNALRGELGAPELPVVVGQLGEFLRTTPDASPFSGLVNEQLAQLPLRARKVAFVSSAGLKDKGDSVHFNTPGLREFGRRYALAYLSLDATWG
ncbi:sialate O-acetylesterase [uncultured Paludibaculum sp.]|uniref:sialate O-acetylesterase n=1 Tax=uncultured Paludibaculum sp. TaxID=1765020 RepID=UPI002AAB8B0D|nr:sialate O-acetylesterase [uncultured Paludibaculum sp.]